MRRGLALAALAALLCGCETARLTENPLSNELTIEREIELSAQIHEQIRKQAKLLNDPLLLDFIYDLGQEIVATTEPQPFVYRFSLIEDDTLNAFTIGGGYVYLNSEVVAQAGDVSELVGVLAHEIAHVRQRHVARRSEGQGLSTLVTLASIAAVALGGADPALLAIGQGINVSLQLKHTRTAEEEADREGIRYMVEAGYEPDGMGRFFQRILAANPSGSGGIPSYLYTHPAAKDRIASARVEIDRIRAPEGLRRDDPRLAKMQARLATLSSTVAGGSGLYARANFDRSVSDPLLERASAARADGDLKSAQAYLDRARESTRAPGDPRVALAHAELAEERGDLKAARTSLERAFALDPNVPLVQYRLGVIHGQLGNRSRAVFFLERATNGFRPGSAARRRAEFEIKRFSFPVLSRSGLGKVRDAEEVARFDKGEPVRWWGDVQSRFMENNPAFDVRWREPGGRIALQQTVRMTPVGRVSATLSTVDARPGRWTVEVRVGDSLIEQRSFDLAATL